MNLQKGEVGRRGNFSLFETDLQRDLDERVLLFHGMSIKLSLFYYFCSTKSKAVAIPAAFPQSHIHNSVPPSLKEVKHPLQK